MGYISSAVEEHIMSCCKERNAAIQLLRDNGFRVSVTSNAERVANLNDHWRTAGNPYSEFISGKRGSGIRRFWDLSATYEVVLFIRNEQVDRVWARVDRTLP